MWEYVEGGDDISWLVEALTNNAAILVTDGSFDCMRAPTVSGAGWVITFLKTHRFIKGSFFEVSSSASANRGELLGFVALHTLTSGLVKYYKIYKAKGKICCDNISALNKSSQRNKRIRTGAKQADLLRVIRTLKLDLGLQFLYEHVDSHQDRYKLWRYLTPEEQIKVDCDH